MKERIWMVVFILAVGSAFAIALVAVNSITEPIIAKNKELKVKANVLTALSIDSTKDKIEEVFSENIQIKKVADQTFYLAKNGQVAFEFAGGGVWGPINGIIALLPDLETIKGITIIHQEETPGLGGRIGDPEYLDKFKGKKIVPELRVVKEPKGKNEVDAITGATLSCEALEEIINSQTEKYIPLLKEKKQ